MEYQFRVDYHDVGENNHLTPTALIRYLGQAAGYASSAVGYGLNDIPQTHLTWLLLNWKVQIFKQPIWDTVLKVKTWPQRTEKFYSFRDFEVYDGSGVLIALASSKWILINTETSAIARVSDEMLKLYGCIDQTAFDEQLDEKLKQPNDFDSKWDYVIQRRDIDTNHHVNNLCYLDYAYEALPQHVYDTFAISTIEIMYKKQLLLGDSISCLYHQDNEHMHTITITNQETGQMHAIVRFTTK